MANTIHQTQMNSRHIAGKPGQLVNLSFQQNQTRTATGADPERKMKKTLTVDTFTIGADYVVVIEGRTITYTALTGDTNQAGVAAQLGSSINADPQVRGIVEAQISGAIITLISLWANLDFSASESDTKMSLVDVDTSLSADAIPFGRALFYAGASAEADKNLLVKLPDLADVTGDVFVLTPNVANTTAYDVALVGPDGAVYTGAYTSDGSATAKEIVEGQKTAIDLLSITGLTTSEDDATLTLNLPVGFNIQYEAPRYTSIVVSSGTNVSDMFAGISVFTHDEEGSEYPANSALSMLERGSIYVANAESVFRNDAVYIETTDGANKGKLYKTASSTRLLLESAKFEADEGNSLASLELN